MAVDDAATTTAAVAPALPTLPHSLVHEICHYLWPADVARLANTCPSLGAKDGEGEQAGTNVSSALIEHGLRIFRPTRALPVDATFELISHRLPRLKGLRVLDLSGAKVDPATLEEMGRLAAEEGAFKSVRVLSFYDSGLGCAGADALARALERGGLRDTLEGLYVRADEIHDNAEGSDEGPALFNVFADGACRAPLRFLCLAQTGLREWAGRHLGRALASPHLKHLKKLDLHHNHLEDGGAEAIAEGLMEGGGMPCLDEIYLGFNNMGDDGAVAVARALSAMPALRELDLANNVIGDMGVVALCLALVPSGDAEQESADAGAAGHGWSWGWVLRFGWCSDDGGRGLPLTLRLEGEAMGGVKSIDLGVEIDGKTCCWYAGPLSTSTTHTSTPGRPCHEIY